MVTKVKRRPNSTGGRAQWNDARRRYEARVTIGTDALGKQKRRWVTGSTTKECQAKVDALVREIDATGKVPDDKVTVATYADHWLTAVLPLENLARRTTEGYADDLRLYVLPHVGRVPLRSLGVPHVERMMGNLATPATRAHAKKVLGKVLRSAQRSLLVDRNVAYLVPMPKKGGVVHRIRVFTPAEYAALVAELRPTRWYPMVLLHAATGLRPGELLGLQWPDVAGGEVRVARAVNRHEELVDTKTVKARRTVPLTPGLGVEQALRWWKTEQKTERLVAGPAWESAWGPLMFTSEDGTPVTDDIYNQAFTRACKRAGLGQHSPYDLRHTYATHLLEAGRPIHEVAELMGDSVDTIETYYSHKGRPKTETANEIASLFRLVMADG